MKKIILALSLLIAGFSAANAQIVTKSAVVSSACVVSPLSCTGFYVGAGLGGVATNFDLVGSGISNSVFAGGAIPFFNAGWQYAAGSMYFAVEAGIGDQFSTNASVNGVSGNQNGVFGFQEVQAGLSLAGLLDITTTPIVSVPTALSNRVIAPYLHLGIAERPWGNGVESGAGVKFDLTSHVMLDIKYTYVDYTGGAANNGPAHFNAENIVSIGAEYKF